MLYSDRLRLYSQTQDLVGKDFPGTNTPAYFGLFVNDKTNFIFIKLLRSSLNKLVCLSQTSFLKHPSWKHRSVSLMAKKILINLSIRDLIHDSSFSSRLTNGSRKLKRYIKISCKELSGTNAVAYRSYSKVMKKMRCCENGPRCHC